MSTNITDIVLRDPLKILSSEPVRSSFLSQASLAERLRVAHEALSPHYQMQLEELWPRTYRLKSDEKSAKYRAAGNSMFSRHKLREAVRLYTEAVLWATPASIDLSMAFANRSAAHFDNACYQASIQAAAG